MLAQNYKYLSPWDPANNNINTPTIQVVTCFLQKGNKILVLQRAKKDIQHNLWGIPGGKLDEGENPIRGLSREIEEETGTRLDPQMFRLLGTACSNTPCDGKYGLYLFHALVPAHFSVRINPSEHYSFLWVSLAQFESLELLTAQREAYLFVKEQLQIIFKTTQGVLC